MPSDLDKYEEFLIRKGYKNAASERRSVALQGDNVAKILLEHLENIERYLNDQRE